MVEEEVPLDTAWKEYDLFKNIEYWIHPDQEKYLSINIKMVKLAIQRRIRELLNYWTSSLYSIRSALKTEWARLRICMTYR